MAIVGIAVFFAVLPLLASTQIVRDRITWEMSAWSGYRVEIGGAPAIDVFPTFRAVMNNVSLSPWADPERRPVIQAERVEIDLSALAALAGNVVFSEMRLIRPTLWVGGNDQAGYRPTFPAGGRITRAIEVARSAIQANPSNPDVSTLPSYAFGRLSFTDGRIVHRLPSEDVELVTSLSGTADWGAVNRSGRLTASGIWRGESINLDVSSPVPLLLFAGGTGQLNLSLSSNPGNLTFQGTATASAKPFADGQVTFNSPSLRRLLEWARTPIAPGAAIGAVSIASHVTGTTDRARFENTEIVMEGKRGTGVLDFSLADAIPSIAGTLAFESLDLRSFLSAFTPLTRTTHAGAEIDTRFTDQMMLDLRVSAAEATAGAIAMSNVAATAQVKNGLAVFDISDATAFGGTLQAGMRLERKSYGNEGELRFMASDIDGAVLGTATGFAGLVPAARGKISASFRGRAPSWQFLLENGEGSIAVNFGAGNLAAVDLGAFLNRASQGGFFALSEIPRATLPIRNAELQAQIRSGIARIEKAEAVSGNRRISLSGLVPYVAGGLALSGGIYPAEGEPAAVRPEATFFVGGNWSAPFVSPVRQSSPPTSE